MFKNESNINDFAKPANEAEYEKYKNNFRNHFWQRINSCSLEPFHNFKIEMKPKFLKKNQLLVKFEIYSSVMLIIESKAESSVGKAKRLPAPASGF